MCCRCRTPHAELEKLIIIPDLFKLSADGLAPLCKPRGLYRQIVQVDAHRRVARRCNRNFESCPPLEAWGYKWSAPFRCSKNGRQKSEGASNKRRDACFRALTCMERIGANVDTLVLLFF